MKKILIKLDKRSHSRKKNPIAKILRSPLYKSKSKSSAKIVKYPRTE